MKRSDLLICTCVSVMLLTVHARAAVVTQIGGTAEIMDVSSPQFSTLLEIGDYLEFSYLVNQSAAVDSAIGNPELGLYLGVTGLTITLEDLSSFSGEGGGMTVWDMPAYSASGDWLSLQLNSHTIQDPIVPGYIVTLSILNLLGTPGTISGNGPEIVESAQLFDLPFPDTHLRIVFVDVSGAGRPSVDIRAKVDPSALIVSTIPEPSAALLLVIALGPFILWRFRVGA